MNDIEELLLKLKKSAKSNKTKKTLDAIHSICREQQERGSKDFSVTTIAKLGKKSGVPNAQSIRNKTGKLYKALINAWKSANPDPRKKHKIKTHTAWIEKIDDPTLRFLAYDLAATNTNLRSELQLLKSVKVLDIDFRTTNQCKELETSLRLVSSEVEALKAAINPEFIKLNGWSTDGHGRIKTDKGKTIYKIGYISAIEKLLSVES